MGSAGFGQVVGQDAIFDSRPDFFTEMHTVDSKKAACETAWIVYRKR